MRFLHRSQRWAFVVIVQLAVLTLLTRHAVAHVKWFCGSVDVTAPPRALRLVLSPSFWPRGLAFLMLVSAGSLVDALVSRRWPARPRQSRHLDSVEECLIRLGVGLYVIFLWDKAAVAPWGAGGDGAILTPELFDHAHWLQLLQLATGLMLVLRRTTPLGALGLGALYAVGIARYGIFHMTDYAYFLGLTAYLALSSTYFDNRPDARRWRLPVLTASLGFSLMWTAIEKFLYPLWTGIVLAAYPNLTLGLPIAFVTMIAGFVEFSLAFYLFVGRGLLRLDAAVLMLVFLAAIPEFGTLDRVGHIPIVAILLVVVLHGTTPLQGATKPRGSGVATAAASSAGLYILAFATMMAMYYGLQKAGTWP